MPFAFEPLGPYVLIEPDAPESVLALPETANAHGGRYKVLAVGRSCAPEVKPGVRIVLDVMGAAGARASGLIAVEMGDGRLRYAVDYRHIVGVLRD